MPRAPLPDDESDRLMALRACEILDTPPEEAFDQLTRLAAELCDAPVALVSLVDSERQWFKSRVGLDAAETPRDLAFCAHAILSESPLVIEDAASDPRTSDNALVLGDPGIRFYAGVPLRTTDGQALGTLCVLDHEPRTLSPESLVRLQLIAKQAEAQLELRRVNRLLRERQHETERLGLILQRTGRLARMGGWHLDLETQALTWTDEVYRIHEVPLGTPVTVEEAIRFYTPEGRVTIERAIERAVEEGTGWDVELPLVTATGKQIWVRAYGEVVEEDGEKALSGALQDITLAKRTELAMRESEARFRTLALNAPVGIFQTDATGACTYVNERWSELTGLSVTEAMGNGWARALHPEDRALVYSAWAAFTSDERAFDLEYRFVRPDTTSVWVKGCAVALENDEGRLTGHIGTIEDISERKTAEIELTHAAHHDQLTGLPNRALLFDRLAQTIARRARDPKHHFGVLFIDFDRFKVVNDSFGHQAGDELLKQIATRLRTAIRPADTVTGGAGRSIVGRFGGDEFVVLLDDLAEPSDALTVARRLVTQSRDSVSIGGHDVVSTASIGLVTSSTATGSPHDILRDADTAMYEAKLAGRGRVVEFDAPMRERVSRRLGLEKRLRSAIGEGRLKNRYGPVVEAAGGRCATVDIRIDTSAVVDVETEREEFLAIAEEAGLLSDMLEHALKEACNHLRRWRLESEDEAPDAVRLDLTGSQFGIDDLPDRLSRIVVASALDHEDVRVQIDHALVTRGRGPALNLMRRLSDEGFPIVLTGFGLATASLTGLRQMPVSEIRLHSSMIETLTDGGALFRSVVELAGNLGLTVVADGVCEPGQVSLLAELGCDFVAGPTAGAPMDAEGVRRSLKG